VSACKVCGAPLPPPEVTWIIAGMAWEQVTCLACVSTRSWRREASGDASLVVLGSFGGVHALEARTVDEAMDSLLAEDPETGAWMATWPAGSELVEGERVLARVTRGHLWHILPPEAG
jgi:hypothetical protein